MATPPQSSNPSNEEELNSLTLDAWTQMISQLLPQDFVREYLTEFNAGREPGIMIGTPWPGEHEIIRPPVNRDDQMDAILRVTPTFVHTYNLKPTFSVSSAAEGSFPDIPETIDISNLFDTETPEESGMNSILVYEYTDRLGWAQLHTEVFPGEWSQQDICQFMMTDRGGESYYFVPGQIGLPDLQTKMSSFPSASDHVFHKALAIRPTEKQPTVDWEKDHYWLATRNLWGGDWYWSDHAKRLTDKYKVTRQFVAHCLSFVRSEGLRGIGL